ncbi:MAG: transposase family protein [Planctomycetota bacterium]
MQNTDLNQPILGLSSPWKVTQVDLNADEQEIVVHLNHLSGTKFCCPECDRELGCYDHPKARRWRHLDSCQFKTMLECSVPGMNCPEHEVKQNSVPWTSPGSRFELMFEAFTIGLLKTTQNEKGASQILRIGWEATWRIMRLAAARSKARKQSQPLPHNKIDWLEKQLAIWCIQFATRIILRPKTIL